ncbi:MAG: 2-oxoacid:ferredoxin oxidoreductase subunit beta [Chloroflexi bacterium]|nr:2-oxoacid:ferredoxin oxidoreductase subunit beta [Chloroflexota bacterium]
MSKKNPEYDFKWCPGCGDFGVRRAIEMALVERVAKTKEPIEKTVVVAGIGCSGNMVHLLEGPQPFGIHGIHGRTLPMALGIKMSRSELNVLVVAGDGDFLSIGAEHIAPQAQRNLNITVVIMDNGVYGLTKGQSSPTTKMGVVTSSTPFGKLESPLNPLDLYLSYGVSFIASGFSAQIKPLSQLILQGMEYPGFSIIQVQSPCTTYNDTFELLKGNEKKNLAPVVRAVPDTHDPGDRRAAYNLIHEPGIPIGLIYKNPETVPLEQRVAKASEKARAQAPAQLLASLRT